MTICTTILNGTYANITNITSLYTSIGHGISCSSGTPPNIMSWGIVIALYIIITGVGIARGFEPDSASMVGSVVGLVSSLFLMGAGMSGSLLVGVMLGVMLLSTMVALFRGWAKPYG